jgi:hypothetical protein
MSNNKYFEMKIFLNKIKINFNSQTIKYINKKKSRIYKFDWILKISTHDIYYPLSFVIPILSNFHKLWGQVISIFFNSLDYTWFKYDRCSKFFEHP